jgi:hypothetical protein
MISSMLPTSQRHEGELFFLQVQAKTGEAGGIGFMTDNAL